MSTQNKIHIAYNEHQRNHFLIGLAASDLTMDLHDIISNIKCSQVSPKDQHPPLFYNYKFTEQQIDKLIIAMDYSMDDIVNDHHYVSVNDTKQMLTEILTDKNKYNYRFGICL